LSWRTNRRTGSRFVATKPGNIEAVAKSFVEPIEMVNPRSGEEGFLYKGILYKGGPMTREEEVAMLVDSGMSDEEAIRAATARRIRGGFVARRGVGRVR
jgi:hypothetical protein